jgi:hypothetical protein
MERRGPRSRLPSGRPPDPAEFGDADRRAYVAAAVRVAHDGGHFEVTGAAIVEEAGGSRRPFHEVFSSPEACLRQGLAEAHERLFEPFRLTAAEDEWIAQLDTAIGGYLAAVGAEPHLAELFILRSYAIEAPGDEFMAAGGGGRRRAASPRTPSVE